MSYTHCLPWENMQTCRIYLLLLALAGAFTHAAVIPEGFTELECVLELRPRQKNSILSGNWAGYVAAENLSTSVLYTASAISATWIVPEILPPTGNNPIAYKIYRDAALTELIATLPGNIVEYDDHNINPLYDYSYYIVSIGQNGSPSYTASTTVQATNGSRQSPPGASIDGPKNFTGVTKQNIFLNAIDTYNHLSWSPPQLANTDCSIWVGIDGYTSPTVEQIGTEHTWNNGTVTHAAWFEMFPAPAFYITSFPLVQGDIIQAIVEYQGSDQGNDVFALTIMNNTQNYFITIPSELTTVPQVDRSCVEWIVEAPAEAGLILPLANFNVIYWSGCTTTIKSNAEFITGPINDPNWQSSSITMQSAGIVRAVPSSLTNSGENFDVTWLHD